MYTLSLPIGSREHLRGLVYNTRTRISISGDLNPFAKALMSDAASPQIVPSVECIPTAILLWNAAIVTRCRYFQRLRLYRLLSNALLVSPALSALLIQGELYDHLTE